jgi:hypothetical protein
VSDITVTYEELRVAGGEVNTEYAHIMPDCMSFNMSRTVTRGLYFHFLTFIYRVYYYSRSCD